MAFVISIIILYFFRYEMSNCLFEAAFENILEWCKCSPGFHTMGGGEAMEKYEICVGPSLSCMNDRLNRMGEQFSLSIGLSLPVEVESNQSSRK